MRLRHMSGDGRGIPGDRMLTMLLTLLPALAGCDPAAEADRALVVLEKSPEEADQVAAEALAGLGCLDRPVDRAVLARLWQVRGAANVLAGRQDEGSRLFRQSCAVRWGFQLSQEAPSVQDLYFDACDERWETATLTLAAVPAEADLYIDGEERSGLEHDVRIGVHFLQVLGGEAAFARQVDVPLGGAIVNPSPPETPGRSSQSSGRGKTARNVMRGLGWAGLVGGAALGASAWHSNYRLEQSVKAGSYTLGSVGRRWDRQAAVAGGGAGAHRRGGRFKRAPGPGSP